MARSLPVLNTSSPDTSGPRRAGQVRLGIGIEVITIVWMVIEATVALTTGFATRSVSLEGFGIDSILELIAGGILLWRLLIEQQGGTSERVEQAERRASWVTALGLFALSLYIVGDSALTFLTRTRPKSSWFGRHLHSLGNLWNVSTEEQDLISHPHLNVQQRKGTR